jgi:hypothetical protein
MIKKSRYLEVGGLDEQNLPIAFNDVDFCLRLMEKGYMNVFTPYCEAIHAESSSRGYEDTSEKKSRFDRESEYLRFRHNQIFEYGDPWYNPNFTSESENMRFAGDIDDKSLFGIFKRGKNGRMYYEPIMYKNT